MLSVLSILLVLAAPPASPTTAPSAAADTVTLKKIGSTSTKSLCARIVERANVAIEHAVANDQSLARLTLTLHATDFDGLNTMQRTNAIDNLDKQAGAVRYSAAAALKAAADLRADATIATDPEQAEDLKAFADAISGAIARQRKEAQDFQSAVTIYNGRLDTAQIESIRRQAEQMMPLSDPHAIWAANQPSQLQQPPKHVNDYFRPVAADFDERAALIRADEGVASSRSIGAVKGC
jgi:hypothetical protein